MKHFGTLVVAIMVVLTIGEQASELLLIIIS